MSGTKKSRGDVFAEDFREMAEGGNAGQYLDQKSLNHVRLQMQQNPEIQKVVKGNRALQKIVSGSGNMTVEDGSTAMKLLSQNNVAKYGMTPAIRTQTFLKKSNALEKEANELIKEAKMYKKMSRA